MPWEDVFHKFKHGKLHSGSKTGKKVTNRKQAIAIAMSEKRKGESGKTEYQSKSKGLDVAPSRKLRKRHGV